MIIKNNEKIVTETDRARQIFIDAGLTYENIGSKEFAKLIEFIKKELAYGNLLGETDMTLNEDIHIKYDKNGAIKYAHIQVDSSYFKKRQAISFEEENRVGEAWIGFAGWADSDNVKYFTNAFEKWVRTCFLSTGLKDQFGEDICFGDIVHWTDGGDYLPIERGLKERWDRIAVVIKNGIEVNFDVFDSPSENVRAKKPIFHYGNFIYQDTEKYLTVVAKSKKDYEEKFRTVGHCLQYVLNKKEEKQNAQNAREATFIDVDEEMHEQAEQDAEYAEQRAEMDEAMLWGI